MPLAIPGRDLRLFGWRACGAMDGSADALVGAATADVSAHEVVDVGVGRLRLFCEQRDCGHNLSRLAVAALGNVFFDPGYLYWVGAVGRESFDRGDFLSAYARDRRDARARGFAVDVHGASAAESHPAAEFC